MKTALHTLMRPVEAEALVLRLTAEGWKVQAVGSDVVTSPTYTRDAPLEEIMFWVLLVKYEGES